jgi:hypothetical protein
MACHESFAYNAHGDSGDLQSEVWHYSPIFLTLNYTTTTTTNALSFSSWSKQRTGSGQFLSKTDTLKCLGSQHHGLSGL